MIIYNLPKDVPVKQFWAFTLYSEYTRRHYENGGTELKTANSSSRDKDLVHNADVTVDIYVGPNAPSGSKHNYMKTVGTVG